MLKRLVLVSLLCVTAAVAGAEEIRFIPAASSSPGRFGTTWSTDLWIYNLQDDGPITVWASFLGPADGKAAGEEMAVDLPTGAMVTVHDAVRELFGLTASGAIRLRSEYRFEARSRTFNQADGGGELGQGIPAVALPASEGAEVMLNSSGALLGAGNVPGADGVRTNLGLLNTSDETVTFDVWVFQDEPERTLVGFRRSLEIGPGEWFQADVFELVNAADRVVPSARVMFWDEDRGQGLIGYLSRVDNRSGDATYTDRVVPRRYRVTPLMYSGEIQLHYDGVLEVDSITYSGPDGGDVVVLEPPDGWIETAEVSSNRDFCYRFIAHVNEGESGSAILQFSLQASGDGGGGAAAGFDSCDGEGPAQCVMEGCWYLP